MKILITTDAYDNIMNGVAISVQNLTTALQAEGHEVHILTLSATSDSHQDGNVYYLRSIPLKIYPDARIALSMEQTFLHDILAWKPDIIHSQCEFSTFYPARKIAKRLHIPLVHTYHTLYEYYTHYFCPSRNLGHRIVSFASRVICNQTDLVIAPTRKTAQILESYRVTVPLRVIPSGLDLKHLQTQEDPYFQKKLKLRLQIPHEQVAGYYRLGGVFVSASQSETQGLTYIEAMACGLPLLCRKDACLENVLVPQYNGLYFENTDDFVQGCLALLCSAKTCAGMQKNILQSVSQFSSETFGKRVLYLYQDIIKTKEEETICTPFTCISKQIWHKVTGF